MSPFMHNMGGESTAAARLQLRRKSFEINNKHELNAHGNQQKK